MENWPRRAANDDVTGAETQCRDERNDRRGGILRLFWMFSMGSLFIAVPAVAQVSVSVPGYSVQVDSTSGKAAVDGTNGIDSDVQIEGITIINDKLFIDGVEVRRGKTVYTSPKSKKTYKIQWGKNGNISVAEK
jgi:hypothetical protein